MTVDNGGRPYSLYKVRESAGLLRFGEGIDLSVHAAVAAALFSLIQALVGLETELIGGDGGAPVGGHSAETDGQPDGLAVDDEGLGAVACHDGIRPRLAQTPGGLDHGEFLTAPATEGAACQRFETAAGFLEHFVAGEVTVGIVDLLEVVKIEDHEAHTVAGELFQLILDMILEAGTVQRSGQSVVTAQMIIVIVGEGTYRFQKQGDGEERRVQEREAQHERIGIPVPEQGAPRLRPEEEDQRREHEQREGDAALSPEKEQTAGGEHGAPDGAEALRLAGNDEEDEEPQDLRNEQANGKKSQA